LPGKNKQQAAQAEEIEDIRNAVQTIEKRSQGLLNFVDTYRNLTRIKKPEFKIIRVSELFNGIEQLMRSKVQEKKITFTASTQPRTLEVTADPELIEQVLINLLINAIHAVADKEDARIGMQAGINKQGRIMIEVADNGIGMSEEVREKIFIPFFSTKRDGSGIGLSLSRQIMLLHKGSISVQSQPDAGTVINLKF